MDSASVDAAEQATRFVPGAVSVIIPAYNSAGTIEAAISSALAQTVAPLEVLVIDDGSTDDTADRAAAFGPPVRLLRKQNGGPGSARNHGARLARGEWLGLLDADDLWFPDKIERQLALGQCPRIGIIGGLDTHSRMGVPAEIHFAALWRCNLLCNSSVLIRREAFEAVGGFSENRALISTEDYNLWLRVSAAGWRIVTCQEVVIDYARGQGLSSQLGRFLAASLANVDESGRALQMSEADIRAKRREVLREFGRRALYERQLGVARSVMHRSLACGPSVADAARLAAACLPAPVLDARRTVSAAVAARIPHRAARLFGEPVAPASLARLGPFLLVVIDTEEEFDWNEVPTRQTSIAAMRSQVTAQRLFEPYGLIPTYAVDYAVGSQYEGYAPLLDLLAGGHCEVGAQLHPWLNPPLSEALTVRNSFPGNLPPTLEAEKISILTRVIQDNLGVSPMLYRAGRFGLGPATASALLACGYKVDCSVRPLFSHRSAGGPDYSTAPPKPFWFGPGGTLLELPVTTGVTGALSFAGRRAYPLVASKLSRSLRLTGALARAGVVNRVQLTPEGNSLPEAKRLTEVLLRQGHQVFVMSYHSPSLVPGNTPYVRSDRDLRAFLDWITGYLEFFFGKLGGSASTPAAIHRLASRLR